MAHGGHLVACFSSVYFSGRLAGLLVELETNRVGLVYVQGLVGELFNVGNAASEQTSVPVLETFQTDIRVGLAIVRKVAVFANPYRVSHPILYYFSKEFVLFSNFSSFLFFQIFLSRTERVRKRKKKRERERRKKGVQKIYIIKNIYVIEWSEQERLVKNGQGLVSIYFYLF
jgi:hypothetical protein